MVITTLTGGDDHGQAYRKVAQALKEVLLRPARLAALSDARPRSRGEREGAGDADGAPREAEQGRGGQDQGEGEPDPGQEEDVYPEAVEPAWAWSGSQPFSVTNPHVYLSTGCYHGDHAYCQRGVRGDGGEKRPAQCKFCDARCICDCHR